MIGLLIKEERPIAFFGLLAHALAPWCAIALAVPVIVITITNRTGAAIPDSHPGNGQ